jgi:cytochrome c peroxidase
MKDGSEHFFVPTPANTGLRPNDPSADGGVGDVTLRPADLGSFKSPSLRNVEVTAPYGHDGRFATLGGVIDHYSENAVFDLNLAYVIPVGPLKFTTSEKAALYYGDIKNIVLPVGERTPERWFKTDGFERVPANQLSF